MKLRGSFDGHGYASVRLNKLQGIFHVGDREFSVTTTQMNMVAAFIDLAKRGYNFASAKQMAEVMVAKVLSESSYQGSVSNFLIMILLMMAVFQYIILIRLKPILYF